MNALITVLRSITPTTMPYNEFALFRLHHFPDEKQILLLTDNAIKIPKSEIPSEFEVFYVEKNPIKIREVIRSIVAKNKHCVFHFHSPRGTLAVLFSMVGIVSRKATVFTVHNTFSGYKLHNRILSFLAGLWSYRVTCVSNASYEKYPKIIKKIKQKRICAVPNGVDLERIDKIVMNSCDDKRSHDTVYLVYVARMVPVKNHKFLIDVLRKTNNNVKMIFVGAEDVAGEIRRQAIEQKVLDRIEFTGVIPREEVFRRLKLADIYVSSSVLEGLPISVLEAMACGLPVILSDIPQHREIAQQADFIPILPLNTDIWVKEINRISQMSPTERKYLGKQCRNLVQNQFSLSQMHKSYSKIYNEIWNSL